MTNTTYNGWTNYATWRVNLEIFDGWDSDHLDSLTMGDTYQLHQQLKDYAEEIIFLDSHLGNKTPSSLMEDYARAFLLDVNWYEIAEHLIRDYKSDNDDENLEINLDNGLSCINE